MTSSAGALHLVPNALDAGAPHAAADLREVLPMGVLRVAARLDHWVAENAKATRAFLKRVDAVVPLALPMQSITIVEMPRPQKGGGGDARQEPAAMARLLEPALGGRDLGLISDAGLPAVADPGARLVEAAHGLGLRVIAWPGASSLLLALAASGLHGQSFAFVGYLPTEAAARASRIKGLENLSRQHGQTQLMIETPYRNEALLGALLDHLQPTTRVSVSAGLTLPDSHTRTDTVAGWRARRDALPADVPAVFALLAGAKESART